MEALARAVFSAAGAAPAEAEQMAGSLVAASLAGCDSHGVMRIPEYVELIRQGVIRPGAEMEVVHETASLAVIDGHWGFGQVTAAAAMRLAMEKARATGLGGVAVRGCNHLGRAGEFALMAAAEGMMGMVMVNSPQTGALGMAPFGGREGRLAPNVLCFAMPRRGNQPFLLDMTCSVIPEGKLRLLRNRGEPLPPDAAVDGRGQPTTDPAAVYGPPLGALLPLGGKAGHKGFGLALVCDILAGALGGSGTSQSRSDHAGNGAFMLALDVSQMGGEEAFAQELEGLAARVKNCPTLPGFEEILFPGELEARTEEKRRKEGIPIDVETWRQIAEAAQCLGQGEAVAQAAKGS